MQILLAFGFSKGAGFISSFLLVESACAYFASCSQLFAKTCVFNELFFASFCGVFLQNFAEKTQHFDFFASKRTMKLNYPFFRPKSNKIHQQFVKLPFIIFKQFSVKHIEFKKSCYTLYRFEIYKS